jgi:hypothetical protein
MSLTVRVKCCRCRDDPGLCQVFSGPQIFLQIRTVKKN